MGAARLICADNVFLGTGSQSATWKGNGGGRWSAVIACFRTQKITTVVQEHVADPVPPPPKQRPALSLDFRALWCNRHNILGCNACIGNGWQFRQPNEPPLIAITAPSPPHSSMPQPNAVHRAASKALTGHVKPSQGSLYRNNRGTDNQRKIK